nr:MAG TPA: SAVED-fused 2TM effector domain [Caudoviricetes sp.]
MTEPTLSSQLLGLVAIFIGFFILILLTAKNKEAEQKTVIIIEEAEDFREIARRNLKNCDRGFTYDSQPPVGLPSTIEDAPQDFRQCIEDYDRLASDYQEEARINDLLRSQNANLLEENGRLLYKEMTMDFRQNPRKWRAKT